MVRSSLSAGKLADRLLDDLGGSPPPVASVLPSRLKATLAKPSRWSEMISGSRSDLQVEDPHRAIAAGESQSRAVVIIGQCKSGSPGA